MVTGFPVSFLNCSALFARPGLSEPGLNTFNSAAGAITATASSAVKTTRTITPPRRWDARHAASRFGRRQGFFAVYCRTSTRTTNRRDSVMKNFGFVSLAVILLAVPAFAQSSLFDRYDVNMTKWAQLPAGTDWGGETSMVAADGKGHVIVIDRAAPYFREFTT